MNPTPARVLMVYGADNDCWLGFLVVREGTFLAVSLAGDELGPFRTQDAAVAALSRRRRVETSFSPPMAPERP
jgi:hypothetical protein